MTREEQLACLKDRPCSVCKFHTNGCSQWTCIFEDEPEEQESCEDCISRAELLKAVDTWDKFGCDADTKLVPVKDCYVPYIHYDDVVKAIKGMPSIQPNPKTGHWIPTSERLPEAGEYIGDVAKYYLVQNEYGDMLVARYTHSEYWEQMYQLKPIADEIVAWMPLPEPYKQKGEE